MSSILPVVKDVLTDRFESGAFLIASDFSPSAGIRGTSCLVRIGLPFITAYSYIIQVAKR